MTGPVFAPIHVVGQQLHVLSAVHRLYVGLSRDGSYLHIVSPTQVEVLDEEGNVVRPAGILACTCRGGVFHGRCYRIDQAEALEAGQRDVVAWLPEPEAVPV